MRSYPRRRANPPIKVMGSQGFAGALNQLSHPSLIKDNELTEVRNARYGANGVVSKRLGSTTLGATSGNHINSLQGTYDIGGSSDYFIRISDTGIAQFYNFNTSVWTNITGSPTFSDVYTNIVQAYGRVYFLNAVDPMTYWNGVSWTVFTAIDDPSSAPTAAKTGSGDDNVTKYYRYVWYNEVGTTLASDSFEVTDLPKELSSSTYVTVTLPSAPAGAVFTGIFRGSLEGEEVYLAKVPASQLTYIDNGTDEEDDLFGVPTSNTTGGFHFKYVDVYRSTLIGVTVEEGDDTLVFSGGGDKFDSFGRADGGGFYAWRKGDGDPITGVRAFTASNEDGLYVTKRSKIGVFRFDESGGAVKDINVAFGAVSHLSIHPAGNDLRLWGEDGAGSVGNEANYATIIRTRILSIKAETTAKSVTFSDASKICGVYFDGLSIFGLPTGDEGDGNNTCLVYDDRYTAWSEWRGLTPSIFATFIGPDKKKRLYFGSSVAGKVVEMFKGTTDDGEPIVFRITTKQFNNDQPYRYKKYKRIIFVFGNVTGTDSKVKLLEDGVRSQLPFTINADTGNTGFDVDLWDDILFDDSSGTYSADTSGLIVRYADLNNKDLFSIQATIENSGLADEISVIGMFILFSESNKPLKSTLKLSRDASA